MNTIQENPTRFTSKTDDTHHMIINHPLFSQSDFEFLASHGKSESEILEMWNRDWLQGHRLPLHHR